MPRKYKRRTKINAEGKSVRKTPGWILRKIKNSPGYLTACAMPELPQSEVIPWLMQHVSVRRWILNVVRTQRAIGYSHGADFFDGWWEGTKGTLKPTKIARAHSEEWLLAVSNDCPRVRHGVPNQEDWKFENSALIQWLAAHEPTRKATANWFAKHGAIRPMGPAGDLWVGAGVEPLPKPQKPALPPVERCGTLS
jgi:hypothetical protein